MTSRYDLDGELRLLRQSQYFNAKYEPALQRLRQKENAIRLLQETISRACATLQNIELDITRLAGPLFVGSPRQKHEEGVLLEAMKLKSYNTLEVHLAKHKALISHNEYRDDKIAVQEGATQYEFYKEKYNH